MLKISDSCSIRVEEFVYVLRDADGMELRRQEVIFGLADYAFDRGAWSVTHDYDLLKVLPDGSFAS